MLSFPRPLLLALLLCGLAGALLLLGLASSPARAASLPQDPPPPLPLPTASPFLDQEPVPVPQERQRRFVDRYAELAGAPVGSASPVAVMVELVEPPTAQVYARTLEATRGARDLAIRQAQAQLARIQAEQAALLPELTRLGGQILHRTQRVYNGVQLLVDAQRIPQIQRLPGVKAVHRLRPQRVALSRSLPQVGAPSLWGLLASQGLDGRRVSIGIIDTGIDYLHADFGGPGQGYEENDPTVITDVVAGITFPTAKVVGGYDFVGDDYNASVVEKSVPQPDPDPMDCYGHGTHVAGIAGGQGVTREGKPYTGPYSATLDLDNFRIAPGVAPRAELYALKVFGCGGSTLMTTAAIEWAVDPNGDGDFSDRLDVVNLSLGAPFGSPLDPSAVASDNAALAGVVVVAAAGNQGDVFYVVSSPSVAARAISVGASVLGDALPTFTARGPRRGDGALKPDLVAPGQGIVSAQAGSGSGSRALSGTSMAAPHVAGAAALLRQLHPSWSVAELKALLINQAQNFLAQPGSSRKYGLGRVGGGRLALSGLEGLAQVVYDADAPGQVHLSFGQPRVLGQASLLRRARLVNRAGVTRTYRLTYTPVVHLPGVAVRFPNGPLVTAPPYSSVDVPVMLTVDGAALQRVPDPTLGQPLGLPRHWFPGEEGYLRFVPQDPGAPSLSLPLYAVPRLASDMRSREASLTFGAQVTGTRAITLVGAGVQTASPLSAGRYPTDTVSLVSAFELQLSSPNQRLSPVALDHADLRYVGVASDVQEAGRVEDARVLFGIVTYGEWSTPNQVAFEVYIDVDEDGEADYMVSNDSLGAFRGGDPTDQFVSVVRNVASETQELAYFLNLASGAELDTGVFHTNSMVLAVDARAIGLSSQDSNFNYWVLARSADTDPSWQIVDVSRLLRYDLSAPGLTLTALGQGGLSVFYDLPGQVIQATFDREAFTRLEDQGVLLIHHFNERDQRGEAIPVDALWRYYFPWVGR